MNSPNSNSEIKDNVLGFYVREDKDKDYSASDDPGDAYSYGWWKSYLDKPGEFDLDKAVEEARAAAVARAGIEPTLTTSSIPSSSILPADLNELVAAHELAQKEFEDGKYRPSRVFQVSKGRGVQEIPGYNRLLGKYGLLNTETGEINVSNAENVRHFNYEVSVLRAYQQQQEILRQSLQYHIGQKAGGVGLFKDEVDFFINEGVLKNESVKQKAQETVVKLQESAAQKNALSALNGQMTATEADAQKLSPEVGVQSQAIFQELMGASRAELGEIIGEAYGEKISEREKVALVEKFARAQGRFANISENQKQKFLSGLSKGVEAAISDPHFGLTPETVTRVELTRNANREIVLLQTHYSPREDEGRGKVGVSQIKAIDVSSVHQTVREMKKAAAQLEAGGYARDAKVLKKQWESLERDPVAAGIRYATTDWAVKGLIDIAPGPLKEPIKGITDALIFGHKYEWQKKYQKSIDPLLLTYLTEDAMKNVFMGIVKQTPLYDSEGNLRPAEVAGRVVRRTLELPFDGLAFGLDKIKLKGAAKKVKKRKEEEDNVILLLLKLLADAGIALGKAVLSPAVRALSKIIPQPIKTALTRVWAAVDGAVGPVIRGITFLGEITGISFTSLKGAGWGGLFGFIMSGGNPLATIAGSAGGYAFRWFLEAGRSGHPWLRGWQNNTSLGRIAQRFGVAGLTNKELLARGFSDIDIARFGRFRSLLRVPAVGLGIGWEIGYAMGGVPGGILGAIIGGGIENIGWSLLKRILGPLMEVLSKTVFGAIGRLFMRALPFLSLGNIVWEIYNNLLAGTGFGQIAAGILTNPLNWPGLGLLGSWFLKLFGLWGPGASILGLLSGLFSGIGTSMSVFFGGLLGSLTGAIVGAGVAGIFAVCLLGVVAVLVTINIFSAFKSFEDEKRWRNLTRPESACFRPSKTADKYKVVAGGTVKYTIDLGTKPVEVKEISLTDEIYIGGTTQVVSETQTDCVGPYVFDDASIAGLLSGALVSPKPDSSYKTISTSGGGCWIKLSWSNLSPNAVITYTLKTDSGYKKTEEITNTLRLDGKVEKKTPTDPDVDCGVQLETAVNAQRKNSCPVRGTISCPSISCHGSADYCAGDLQSLCDSVGIPTGILRGSPDFGKALDIAAPAGTEVFAPEAMAGDKVDLWTLAYTNEGNPKYGGGWAIRLEGKGQPSLLGAAPRKYVLRIAHLARSGTVGAAYSGGAPLNNTVFNSPLGSHIHLELEINAGYVKPEDYICK